MDKTRSRTKTSGATHEVGLDIERFDEDRKGEAVLARIRRDIDSGVDSGEVRGTPTLLVNGSFTEAPTTRRHSRGCLAMSSVCTHPDSIEVTAPDQIAGCEDCLAIGDTWVHLRMCMTREDRLLRPSESPCNAHAGESGHPIICPPSPARTELVLHRRSRLCSRSGHDPSGAPPCGRFVDARRRDFHQTPRFRCSPDSYVRRSRSRHSRLTRRHNRREPAPRRRRGNMGKRALRVATRAPTAFVTDYQPTRLRGGIVTETRVRWDGPRRVVGNARGPAYIHHHVHRARNLAISRGVRIPYAPLSTAQGRARPRVPPWSDVPGDTGKCPGPDRPAHIPTSRAGAHHVGRREPHTPTTTTWGRCFVVGGSYAAAVPESCRHPPTLGSSPSKRQAQLTAPSALQNAASPSTKTS